MECRFLANASLHSVFRKRNRYIRRMGESSSDKLPAKKNAEKGDTKIVDPLENEEQESSESEDGELLTSELVDDLEVLPPEDDEVVSSLLEDNLALDEDEEKESGGRESDGPGSEGIVRYDPVNAYLKEISRYPSLSREEEYDLALKVFHKKDRDAAYKLITSNLWLVVKIARDYQRAARTLMDLVQEGNMGLLEAVKNFDPYRGVRFPSYAVWWIRAYIIRYVIANWRLVKIGTTQAQRKLFFNLRKEKERLEKQGFKPEPKVIANNLNVRESDVIEMEQRLAAGDMSVDAPVSEENDSSLLSILPIDALNAEEEVSRTQLQALLKRTLDEFESTLNEREKLIFDKRLLAEEKATLQDLSDELSVSRERIRQVENRVKEKLKAFLNEKLGSLVENIIEIGG